MNLGKKGTKKELRRLVSRHEKRKSRAAFSVLSMFLAAMILLACLGISIGIGMIRGIIDQAPTITETDIIPSQQKSVIYDSQGNVLKTLVQAGSNRTNVKDYDSVPRNLINAFVDIEDVRFWDHSGIDLKGIIRAAYNGITNNFEFDEGASTITQQLIKNSVFTEWLKEDSLGDRLERKIQEQYLALQLEKTVSKEQILLSYMNTINLGSNTLGIDQATKRYFGKSYKDLTLSECAVIASITNNPTGYNPITHPDKNLERAEKVLEEMEQAEHITEEEKNEALADLHGDLYKRIETQNSKYTDEVEKPNSYFVDSVIEQVTKDLIETRGYTQSQATNLLYSGGLQIHTTMDPTIQAIIDDEVNKEENYTNELTQWSCSFMITVTYEDQTTETFTDISLRIYFRQKKSDFKFIAKTKDELLDYIDEFAHSVIDESKGESYELTSINYTLQPQVSSVLMDQKTGQVLGISGGRGEKTTSLSLNRATDSTRQPGSLFKVLAGFTPAIDACGDTLATVYYDGPYSVGEKSFSNYWGSSYMGYSSIRQSIVYSMNIVAVKALNQTVTPNLAYDYLLKFGFTTLVKSETTASGTILTDINASLSLGGLTKGVTNLETTAAYAAIANHGTYTEPVFYTDITDSDGNIIIDKQPKTKKVMKKTTAYLLTKAMEETMDGIRYPSSNKVTSLYGTGRAADVSGMSIAGKTGTTTGTYDIWFAGFSPYYTAVIWSGYDEQQEIQKSTSTNYHKEIWQKIMTRVHHGLKDTGFKAPSGIVTATICKKSGKLAIAGVCDKDSRGSMVYTEYFDKGTEPTEVCDKHVSVKICKKSGKKAAKNCKDVETKIYMVIDSNDAKDGTTDDSYLALKNLGTCTIDHIAESISESVSISQSESASIKASEDASKAESKKQEESRKAEESRRAEESSRAAEEEDEDSHSEHSGIPSNDI